MKIYNRMNGSSSFGFMQRKYGFVQRHSGISSDIMTHRSQLNHGQG